jgi:hypothetical protein
LRLAALVMREDTPDLVDTIEAALQSIPSLQVACATGQLEIVVSVQASPNLPRPTKRQISDIRPGCAPA